ncbi:MAG: hypothetical protein PHF56_19245 [Desulfuromonadaceae bacterium]|nr:hypothetical protein [Desulfuromonadaceae bacterium]
MNIYLKTYKLFLLLILSIMAVMSPPIADAAAASEVKSKTGILREQQTIVIDGIAEQWRLEWMTMPIPNCNPESEGWSSCPCAGFSFGEQGDLVLVRIRPGKKDEHLQLTPYFMNGDTTGQSLPILRRWDPIESDFDQRYSFGFPIMVRLRPLAQVMNLTDYDNDGRATEFFVQLESVPCGKRSGIVVGISRDNPHLHAFTSTKNNKEPLSLYDYEWEALSRSKGRAVRVIDWACGDHGSDGETELEVKATKGKIYIKSRSYQCTESGDRGRLIKKEPESL